jgi:large subunit ribosomal protein L17
MVTSLLKHDRIRTTDVKAKELRDWADHIITLARRGDLHARRQALSIVREKKVVHKLFAEADKRFAGMSGGYTRIYKLGRRKGDSAPISLIEIVTADTMKKREKKPTKEKIAEPAPRPKPEPIRAADIKPEEPAKAESTPDTQAQPEEETKESDE